MGPLQLRMISNTLYNSAANGIRTTTAALPRATGLPLQQGARPVGTPASTGKEERKSFVRRSRLAAPSSAWASLQARRLLPGHGTTPRASTAAPTRRSISPRPGRESGGRSSGARTTTRPPNTRASRGTPKAKNGTRTLHLAAPPRPWGGSDRRRPPPTRSTPPRASTAAPTRRSTSPCPGRASGGRRRARSNAPSAPSAPRCCGAA